MPCMKRDMSGDTTKTSSQMSFCVQRQTARILLVFWQSISLGKSWGELNILCLSDSHGQSTDVYFVNPNMTQKVFTVFLEYVME